MSEAIKDHVITPAKGPDGEDSKHYFTLTLSVMLRELPEKGKTLMQELAQVDGIENIAPNGNYSLNFALAVTFDPEAVTAEIVEACLAQQQQAGAKIIVPDRSIVTP